MLTIEQRNQERALALALWLDSLLIVPYGIVAVWAGSLAMLSELLRGGLLMIVTGFSLRTLRRTHRGLITDYDYGIGKLERALSVAVAFLLLLAAVFIVWRAFVLGPETPASRFLRVLAIVFVFMNLLANTIPAISLWRATRVQPSVIALSQFRARLAKAVGSIVVVTCVAIHSLAADPMTGRIADTVAALLVVGFMVVIAVGLLREALPDLLDRAIAEPMQVRVNRTLAAFFHDYDELLSVRTRRSGNIAHIEITLGFGRNKTMGEVSQIIARMQDHLRNANPDSDIVIVAHAVEGQPKRGGLDGVPNRGNRIAP
jgi:divalent metal cation (Fe/Co/Zn/Cd) transporter